MTGALEQLAELIQRVSGIVVGPSRLPALRSAIGRVCPGASLPDVLELTADPRHGSATIDLLVDEITINETFFMRHRAELDAIPWARLLADALRRGRPSLRVWSAACSSGEEAYSLAMLALDALPGEPTPVSVLATDISRSCLARASDGRYGERSLRNVTEDERVRYFHDRGDRTAEVHPDLRRHVRVARHNLVRDPIPPPDEVVFDVIVCRNVLIYFDPTTAAHTASRLRGALSGPGLLVLGASDLLAFPRSEPAHAKPTAKRRSGPRRRSTGAGAGDLAPTARPSDRPAIGEPMELALASALADADAGRLSDALATIQPILDADSLNTVALFIRGLVLHAQGDPIGALGSLRRAVYLDPTFARAAFELGRAQDALGDRAAAHRAYRQALEGIKEGTFRDPILGQADEGLANACRFALAAPTGHP